MNEHSNKKTTRKQGGNVGQRGSTDDYRITKSERSSDWYHDTGQRAPRLRPSPGDNEK